MVVTELSPGNLKNKATLTTWTIKAVTEEGTGEALEGPE